MIYIIYTYFLINSFIAGYFLRENNRFETVKYNIVFTSLCLFFGVLAFILVRSFYLFTPILGWIYREIGFQYRFYCTDYWDKILLDDNYSEEYKSREEKLERSEQLVKDGSKQVQRHNKQIQKKYGNK